MKRVEFLQWVDRVQAGIPSVESFLRWLAFKLPWKLVYWCAIRVWAQSTTGKWGTTEAPKITFDTALRRFHLGKGKLVKE